MKVYGIVGWKNSGKTTLVERLVKELTLRGFAVSTIKHAHHDFDVDQPGKDSHRHRSAGAKEVLLSSTRRWALMHELFDESEPPLGDLLDKLSPVDLVLVEGFKSGNHAKIEVRREPATREVLAQQDSQIRAIATDCAPPKTNLPVFDLNNVTAIAEFILAESGLK